MRTCGMIWNGQVMTTLNNFIFINYLIMWLALSDVNNWRFFIKQFNKTCLHILYDCIRKCGLQLFTRFGFLFYFLAKFGDSNVVISKSNKFWQCCKMSFVLEEKISFNASQVFNIFIEYVHPFVATLHINLILEQIYKYLGRWIHNHR
jgi:hypothetical protein